MVSMISTLADVAKREEGQDLIEYAMLAGLIAAAIVAVGIIAYQTGLTSMGNGIRDCIDFKSSTTCAPGF
jgi:Flp pilus assembly pilin Flp